MDQTVVYIIIGAGALIVGLIAGRFIFAKNTKKQVEEAEYQAQNILKEAELRAETIKKEKQLEAKEKFVQLKSEYDREVLERNRKIGESENRAKQKEISINQKESALDKQIKENEAIKENLNRQIELINIKRTELEKHQEEHIRRLEKIANLSADDARNQLIESLKHEAQTQAMPVCSKSSSTDSRSPLLVRSSPAWPTAFFQKSRTAISARCSGRKMRSTCGISTR